MNLLSRLFCRLYQGAFRLALPLLPYREPKPLASVTETVSLLQSLGKTRVLLITDENLARLGLPQPLLDALKQAGIACAVYARVTPNPTIDHVEEAREAFLRHQAQAVIAFGGGSAIDCAKAALARVARPKKPVRRMRGILKVCRRLPTLIAVPTTAGTGSETTLAAVITDASTHHKYPINDFSLIPHYALLDPAITVGLPPAITATTGMDALTHAVEAYIGRSTTRHTRAMAVEAVTRIRQSLLAAYQNGQDLQARASMLRAAYCAGIAFTQSYVGYVHGIAHSLGGRYSTPHGLANAVLLPYVLDAYGPACTTKLARLARESGVVSDPAYTDEQTAAAFIAWIRGMNRSMSIPDRLPDIREADIPAMARHAAQESNPLYPVPKLMTAAELQPLYRAAAHGTNQPTKED